jgi:cytochrome c
VKASRAANIRRRPICHGESSTSGPLWVGRRKAGDTADMVSQKAQDRETTGRFAACPPRAPRATKGPEPSANPANNEEHSMKKMTLSVLIVIASSAVASAALAQDVAAGKTSFNKCLACHAIGEGAKNKVGPELNGLDGRKSGSAPDYSYTDANKNSGITWSEAEFKDYIKDPKAKIPSTKMIFAGIKNEKEASDLWAFLAQYDKDGKTK